MKAGTDDGNSNATALIEELRRQARVVDKDDLSGLAKMHGWCERLGEAARSEDEACGTRLRKSASELSATLEALILGEAKEPEAALATVVGQVSALSETVGLQPLPQSGAAPRVDKTPDDLNSLGDSEVAARLDQILADDMPPGDAVDSTQAAPPAPSSEAVSIASPAGGPVAVEVGCEPRATGAADGPPYEPEPLVLKDNDCEFVKGFLEEAGEHIEAIEASLLEVEQTPDDSEKINTLFRPFHTIKGMAGFLNLRDINCLTHEVETLLDEGRKGKRSITPGLIDVVFNVVDILKVQLAAISSWIADPKDGAISQPPVAEMIGYLRNIVAGRVEPEGRQPSAGSADQRIGENLVDQGATPKEVVDFVVESQKKEPSGKKVGKMLVDMGAATPKQVSQALRPQVQAKAGTAPKPIGSTKEGPGAPADQSVRIETAKLDSLVDMVGELVIAQTLVSASPAIAANPILSKDVNQVGKIVRDVQEVAMAMRMIPIGTTFHKMARLVRDVSRKMGKQVQLTISGEETELDKNVIQQIGDPLVHMVRNAVDHGIEPPDVRRAAGKPEVGQVHLSACHQGGNIVIEIRDDGKGLDPVELKAKGVEKGLINPDDELTDQQAFALVLAPGFSTAAQVTDISGRGVGMDVVKRNIEQLRGRVDIVSEKGRGSTFSIRLPLTLAIIDGILIRVGSERFIVQTITVEQSLRPLRSQITKVQDRAEVLNLRGKLIPLVQLGALFGISDLVDPCDAMVVITQHDGGQIGLVVEELLGQQQVVIKSLGTRFEKLRGISGAAILGDGRVGLILEMAGLAALLNDWKGTSLSTPSETSPDRGQHVYDDVTEMAPLGDNGDSQPEEDQQKVEMATLT